MSVDCGVCRDPEEDRRDAFREGTADGDTALRMFVQCFIVNPTLLGQATSYNTVFKSKCYSKQQQKYILK